jgi:hypothetical protein
MVQKLRITAEHHTFIAALESEKAPQTCAAFLAKPGRLPETIS